MPGLSLLEAGRFCWIPQPVRSKNEIKIIAISFWRIIAFIVIIVVLVMYFQRESGG